MKSPKIQLGRYTKTFGLLIPVAGASVTCGIVHDIPSLGDGMKNGCYGALTVLALFFLFVAIKTVISDIHFTQG